jgi:hypothetical protein
MKRWLFWLEEECNDRSLRTGGWLPKWVWKILSRTFAWIGDEIWPPRM